MEQIRRLSKQLFGAAYRLEVGASLVAGELISLTSLSERMGKPPSVSSIAKELQTFEQAGLLRRHPPVEGLRTVYLEPIETPFWDTCRHLSAFTGKSSPINHPLPAEQ